MAQAGVIERGDGRVVMQRHLGGPGKAPAGGVANADDDDVR
jgi:hypothetical protein